MTGEGILLLAMTIGFLFCGPAAACPMCKESAQGSPKLTEGFARSIHLLMGMPYLLFGGLALYVARSARKYHSRGQTPSDPKGV